MEVHEAAEMFPLDEETIRELADDIARRGLAEPIKLLGGKILDGRRRLRACQLAGVSPRFEEVTTDDPIAYSWSLNGTRRNLTPSQKAMVGARMRAMYDEQAKERQREAGERGAEGGRGNKKTLPANLPEGTPAKIVGVGARTIDYATRVIREGTPEIIQAVDEGRLAVSTASEIVRNGEPQEEPEPESDPEVEEEGVAEPPKKWTEYYPPREARGAVLAHEAINALMKIPKDDPQRALARQMVIKWINKNLKE
jgi:ParB-like chromosome segregation protein Spo0J